jgi:chromosome segregation ATPase
MEIQHKNDSLQQILNESKRSHGSWKEKIDNLEEQLEKQNSEKIQLQSIIKSLSHEIEK